MLFAVDAPPRKRTRSSVDAYQDSLEAVLVDALCIDRMPRAPVQQSLEKEGDVRLVAQRLCALLKKSPPRGFDARATRESSDRLQLQLDELSQKTTSLDRLVLVEELHARVIRIASTVQARPGDRRIHEGDPHLRPLTSLLAIMENPSAPMLSVGREIARLTGGADFEHLGSVVRVDLLLCRDAVAQAVDGILSVAEAQSCLCVLKESLRKELRRRQRLLLDGETHP